MSWGSGEAFQNVGLSDTQAVLVLIVKTAENWEGGAKLCKLRCTRSALGPCHNGPGQTLVVTSGHQRFREPQVARLPAQAAGMMRAGDSGCGPEGRGFESPRSPSC